MSNKNKISFLTEKDYRKFLDYMPIACVDIVVICGGKFLMGKRANAPAKDSWWFPGGRVLKGETLEEAAVRKIKEELRIKTKTGDYKFLTTDQTIFKDSARKGISTHSINSVFLIRLGKKQDIDIKDSDLAEIKWFDSVEKEFNSYIKKILESVGFEVKKLN